ncbi:peptidoglycan recognition protein-like [Maniola hyperantus]|uniref:peptidoglycan recognition protein-like n=1 Tax=Aphantopus hyperantus TaxID=2795564 RepID=UPI003749AC6E
MAAVRVLNVVFLMIATVSQSRIAAADCDAVPIEKWGGSPLNRLKDLEKPVRIAVIQHTVTPECTADAECEEAVRKIREMQTKHGFDDIAQSFVIGGNGKVYAGAGWKVGAHTLRWNNKSISISFIGDFRECDVVSKKQWDGLNPIHVEYLPRPVDLVIIQHSVTAGCSTDAACEDLVRNIQDYHMEQLKFWDIGMSFMVGGNGKVYEGNGWLRVGAHTFGYNRRSIGISFLGNYNNDEPKPEQLEAVKNLIKCGVEKGHLSPDYHLVGHKQLISTESPGRKLYREIRTWPHFLEDVSSIRAV